MQWLVSELPWLKTRNRTEQAQHGPSFSYCWVLTLRLDGLDGSMVEISEILVVVLVAIEGFQRARISGQGLAHLGPLYSITGVPKRATYNSSPYQIWCMNMRWGVHCFWDHRVFWLL